MKHFNLNRRSIFAFTLLALISISGCGSKFGAGFDADDNSSGGTPNNPIDGVVDGSACSDYKPISGAYDVARRHVFLGEFRFTKDSSPQKIYRQFIGDFGNFCANNQNGVWRTNPITGQSEYVYGWYNGVSNCSNWDDIAKVWISFPKGNPTRAHITIDATMSGYPDGWNGQGYDTQRIQLTNAQIDCNVDNKINIYFEPVSGYQFMASIYKGNKSAEFMRAELFYKGGSLGKNDLFIVKQ